MYLAKRGLEGDGAATRATLTMYEMKRHSTHAGRPIVIVRKF